MKKLIYFLFALTFLTAQEYQVKDFGNLMGMPGFSDSLLQIHFKLYAGYVKNTNDLLTKIKGMADSGQTGSYEYGALKRRLGWEFDGMRLHELYFSNLGGDGQPDPNSALYQAIAAQYGSFDAWKKDFVATGMMRGIGWSVLYYDFGSGRLINEWINEHDGGHLVTSKPILIMDVFEHAYMPQYGLDKAKYIDAFFQNTDWKVVSNRYSK